MTTLLKLRVFQLRREINEGGPAIVIAIGFLWFLIYGSYLQYQTKHTAISLTAALFLVSLFIQLNRKDKSFIYTHLSRPYWQIYAEYCCLTFPFSFSCLITDNWFCLPLLLSLLLLPPIFKYEKSNRTLFKKLSSFIPVANFEWISGFRKYYLTLVPLYFLSLGFSWLPILPLGLIWITTLIICNFHNECEPLNLLKETNRNTSRFLKQKMLKNTLFISILFSPVLIINSFFQPDYIFINTLFLLSMIILLCFAICLKYSMYWPSKSVISANMNMALAAIFAAIPVLMPVSLFMTVEHFQKAKKHLTQFTDDQH